MQNIYKFQLDFAVKQFVLGKITKLLCVQIQNKTPCLWAIVDSEIDEYQTPIYMVGTGTKDVDKINALDKKYISTTQTNGLVFHWFTR